MSVFKYADNSEEASQDYDDLDEVINEGEADEGEAALGAEFIFDEEDEEDDDDSDEDEEDSFFSTFNKPKGVK